MSLATLIVAGAVIAAQVERMGPHQVDPRCEFTSPADVPRDKAGKIIRSSTAKAEFARLHPCPSTRKSLPTCPGWAIDHVIPRAVGGFDAPINMQWLPLSIKACSSAVQDCKDRFERLIYRCTP